METKTKVQTFEVDFKCPKCKDGFLRPTGTILTSNPPVIPHLCNLDGCNYGENFNRSYPRIEYEYT